MVWNDEVALVFNGEIYNHTELRAELKKKGRQFASESDTEVVLQLYLQEGEAFVQRLRGMFAIAIYDRRPGPGNEVLLLARDVFGIKPLLVAAAGTRLVFASEIRSLLASGVVSAKLDPVAVQQILLRGAVVQPRTILHGVAMLMPATLMRVTSSGIRHERFWRPEPKRRPEAVFSTYGEQVELVEQELGRAVGEQMMADVPLGAFLSGGLDSSIVVGLMARKGAGPVRTFSVGFGADGRELDESEDALEVAAALGTDHRRVEMTDAFVAARLERFSDDLDQPSVDGLNSWLVSEAAASHVKVALSGTGGDELFAGYPWFNTMQEFSRGRGRRGLLARLLSGRNAMAQLDPFISRFAAEYRHFDPAAAARMLGGTSEDMTRSDVETMQAADALDSAGALDRTSALCLGTYTLNQLLRDIDATSMAHSLEVRVPFLDVGLLDLALSLPEEARLGNPDLSAEPGSYCALGTKRILVDIARRLVPVNLGGRAKRGFSLPLDRWLLGCMREPLEESLRHPCSQMAELFLRGQPEAVLDDFLAGRIHWGRPWILLILDLWTRRVGAGRIKASSSAPFAFATFT